MGALRNILQKSRALLFEPLATEGNDTVAQIQLKLTYQRLLAEQGRLPKMGEIGFQCHSQADEDGILLYLFSLVGTSNRLCVEICAGDGIECNTANLILHHGWHGLLADGDPRNVQRGAQYYARCKRTYVYPPQLVHAWVTRDSVNEIISANGFPNDIDLLSLDLDGVDYWIWEALEAVPRVVVLEYQDILGPERSWTVPYSDDFRYQNYPTTDGMPNFAGASLAAFVKLGRQKGYRLVGVNRYGYNAFFVKRGIAEGVLPEIGVRDCFSHPKVVWGMKTRFPTVQDLPWVEV